VTETYIIAELGINANGDRKTALEMMKMAADCGCNAVKFQKRDVLTVYSEEELDKPRASPWGRTTLEQKMGLEFEKEDYDLFFPYAASLGMDCFASAWDTESLFFIESYEPAHHKIASAMLTNTAFVTAVAKMGRHTFISTGMSEWSEIDTAVSIFHHHNCDFTLMHCVACYPCPVSDLNLKIITELQLRYGYGNVGYSGHEVGISPSIAAVVLGAKAIERHITLDRAMYGSDQSASLEREGLRRLVAMIREIEIAMGDGIKRITPQEMDVAQKLRYWKNNK
jgi:N-acetylneuraminate synthase